MIYLALSYCLLVAYLAKGAEVLDFFAGAALPPPLGAAAFVAGAAGVFLVGGAAAADRVNQALTSVLLLLFCGIVAAGAAAADVPAAVAHGHADWGALPPAAPIMFLALVYHDLVPLICGYLGGDRAAVRSALILGSLVPLGMFVAWEAVAVALLPPALLDPAHALDALQVALPLSPDAAGAVALGGGGAADAAGAAPAVDPLALFVRRSGPAVGAAVQGFSFLAVATSFMGTVMGLSETLRSEVPLAAKQAAWLLRGRALASFEEGEGEAAAAAAAPSGGGGGGGGADEGEGFGRDPGRTLALALTLGPPLAFTAHNPDAFVAVLSVAGGYGMTLLYGVLPPLMAWSLRGQAAGEQARAAQAQAQQQEEGAGRGRGSGAALSSSSLPPVFEPMVPGGAPVLAALLAAAVAIEVSRAAADAGLTLGALSSAEGAQALLGALAAAAAAWGA